MGYMQLIQLDSVPVVTRTQYLVLHARLGPHDPDLLDRIAYRHDEWIETWAHEASLVPVTDEPLYRWARARAEAGQTWGSLVRVAREHPDYVEEVLAQVAERPRAAGELVDPRPRAGEWWGSRSLGSLALDWLFRTGRVGIRRRPGFVKEFDLLERIVPAEIRALPTPDEDEAHRRLLDRAGAALGVATVQDLADYHRLPRRRVPARVAELVEAGRLVPARVEGWERPAFLHVDAARRRRPRGRALLSPFDPVVWNRDRARRLFGFDYRVEIYTPAAQRRYGYYVLPFLLGDRLVARVDLKTDRAAGVLRVLGAWSENGAADGELVEALAAELADLARFVGVAGWEVTGGRGDLTGPLRSRADVQPVGSPGAVSAPTGGAPGSGGGAT